MAAIFQAIEEKKKSLENFQPDTKEHTLLKMGNFHALFTAFLSAPSNIIPENARTNFLTTQFSQSKL